MEIQQLTAFDTVASLGSISNAADKLHLTQPAITKRIQALESNLGCQLFDRVGRRLLLTESGQCLLPNARKILRLVADSRQALDDLSGQVEGSLNLVTSHHIGLHRLPAVLQKYRKAYPLVKLKIQFMNSRDSHQNILEADSEVGITTEEAIYTEQLDSFTVWQDKLSFVVARDHPLSNGGERPDKRLTLEQLSKYPALLPDAKFTTGRLVRELFNKHGLILQIDSDLSTDYLETLKALVTIGDGWSVLPHTMTEDSELSVLTPENASLVRNLVCITHRGRTQSRAAKAFTDILKTINS